MQTNSNPVTEPILTSERVRNQAESQRDKPGSNWFMHVRKPADKKPPRPVQSLSKQRTSVLPAGERREDSQQARTNDQNSSSHTSFTKNTVIMQNKNTSQRIRKLIKGSDNGESGVLTDEEDEKTETTVIKGSQSNMFAEETDQYLVTKFKDPNYKKQELSKSQIESRKALNHIRNQSQTNSEPQVDLGNKYHKLRQSQSGTDAIASEKQSDQTSLMQIKTLKEQPECVSSPENAKLAPFFQDKPEIHSLGSSKQTQPAKVKGNVKHAYSGNQDNSFSKGAQSVEDPVIPPSETASIIEPLKVPQISEPALSPPIYIPDKITEADIEESNIKLPELVHPKHDVEIESSDKLGKVGSCSLIEHTFQEPAKIQADKFESLTNQEAFLLMESSPNQRWQVKQQTEDTAQFESINQDRETDNRVSVRGSHLDVELSSSKRQDDFLPNRPMSEKSKLSDIDEQMIFSRLPADYFRKEEEQDDIDQAIGDIKKMRQGFISYVEENNMNEKLSEISDILCPKKFIKRHFGEDQKPEFLFETEIKEVPQPKVKEDREVKIQEGDSILKDGEMLNVKGPLTGETFLKDAKQIDHNITTSLVDQSIISQPIETNPQVQRVCELSEPHMIEVATSSNYLAHNNMPSKSQNTSAILPETFKSKELSPKSGTFSLKYSDKQHEYRSVNPKSSQKFESVKSSSNQSKLPEVNVTKPRQKKKQVLPKKNYNELKMADYFKSDSNLDRPDFTESLHQVTGQMSTARHSSEHTQQVSIINQAHKLPSSNLHQSPRSNQPPDSTQMSKSKEELEMKLEKDILDNIDVNFLFNKGQKLTQGLIDMDRLYQIMNKLKDLAYQQLQRGSKEIDYKEIVKYVRSKDGIFAGEFQTISDAPPTESDDVSKNVQEPEYVKMGDEAEKNRKWQQCVGFLRNNPRLLLQMLPDLSDDDEDATTATNSYTDVKAVNSNQAKLNMQKKKKGRIHTRLEEATKYQQSQGIHYNKRGKKGQSANFRPRNFPGSYSMRSKWPSKPNNNITVVSEAHVLCKSKPGTIEQPQHTNQQNKKVLPDLLLTQKALTTSNQSPSAPQLNHIEDITRFSKPPAFLDKKSIEKSENFNQSNLANSRYKQVGQSLNNPTTADFKTSNAHSVGHIINNHPYNKSQDSRSRSRSGMTRIGRKGDTVRISYQGAPRRGPPAHQVQNYLQGQQSKQFMSTAEGRNVDKVALTGPTPAGQNSPIGVKVADSCSNTTHNFFSRGSSAVGIRRPITAAKRKKAGKRLASNNILKKNAITRSSMRQQQFSQNAPSRGSNLSKKNPVSPVGRKSREDSGVGKSIGFKSLNTSSIAQGNYVGYQTATDRYFIEQLNSSNISNMSNSKLTNKKLAPLPQMSVSPVMNKLGDQSKSMSPANITIDNSSHVMMQDQAQKLRDTVQQDDTDNYMVQQRMQPVPKKKKRVKKSFPKKNSIQVSDDPYENKVLQKRSKSIGSANKSSRSKVQSQSSGKLRSCGSLRSSKTKTMASGASIEEGTVDLKAAESTPIIKQPYEMPAESSQSSYQQTKIDEITEASPDRTGISTASKSGNKEKLIDWAYTPLCINMLKNDSEFNKNKDIKVFVEREVEYVIDMMRNKFTEFKRTDIMRPFYLKAAETLKQLLEEQNMEHQFVNFKKMYREITIENTLKLLLRCKLAFHTRKLLLATFESIMKYELSASDMKYLLEKQDTYKVDMLQYNRINDQSQKMYQEGEKVLQQIKILRADKKSSYRQIFVFKKKDLVRYMKNEMNEIRQLIEVFRVKRVADSEDSDKPARYQVSESDVETEDMPEDQSIVYGNGLINAIVEGNESSELQSRSDIDFDYKYKGQLAKPEQSQFSGQKSLNSIINTSSEAE